MRTNVGELLRKFNKEDFQKMYEDSGFMVYKVAEQLECHKDTVSKILKQFGIKVKKHLVVHTDEVRAKISRSASKRARLQNPISHIHDNNPEWWKKGVITRQENDSYKVPHLNNRKVKGMPREELEVLVNYRGVLGAAKFLDCSQSTIRLHCKALNIKLISGPKPVQTQTEEYKQMKRESTLDQLTNNPIYKNTSIELAVQEGLRNKGLKFRTHKKVINLTVPDILIGKNILVYADGCYWHGCLTCNIKNADKNNVNKNHDKFVNKQLEKAGYKVLRFWEHEINSDLQGCISKIEQAVKGLKN